MSYCREVARSTQAAHPPPPPPLTHTHFFSLQTSTRKKNDFFLLLFSGGKKVPTLSGREYKIIKIKRMISACFVKFGWVNGFRPKTEPGVASFRRVSSGFLASFFSSSDPCGCTIWLYCIQLEGSPASLYFFFIYCELIFFRLQSGISISWSLAGNACLGGWRFQGHVKCSSLCLWT